MNSIMKALLLSGLLLFSSGFILAQDPPFKKDVEEFRKQDSITPPPSRPILLIGSSSFTFWNDVQDYFPGYTLLNRAFGGSTLQDVNYYFDQIVLPYSPKQILIYCGENDFAASDTLQPETVLARYEQLHNKIRTELGSQVDIVYVSMKPSPSRRHLLNKFEKGNALIEAFIAQDENAHYVDVYHPMLSSSGEPRAEIFKDDELHMNAQGYRIWQPLLAHLLKNER